MAFTPVPTINIPANRKTLFWPVLRGACAESINQSIIYLLTSHKLYLSTVTTQASSQRFSTDEFLLWLDYPICNSGTSLQGHAVTGPKEPKMGGGIANVNKLLI